MVAKRLSKSKILRFNRKRENGNVSKGVYQKYSFVQGQDSDYSCLLKRSHNLFYFKIQFICYTAYSFKYLYAYVSLFKSCDSNFVTASFLDHDHTSLIQTHSRLFPVEQLAWFNWIKVTEKSEKGDWFFLFHKFQMVRPWWNS